MRKEAIKLKILLIANIFCIAASSAMIAIIPLGDFNGNHTEMTIAYMIGAVFWGGVIVGGCLFSTLNRMRKKTQWGWLLPKSQKTRIGAFTFFRNRAAVITDIICGLSFIASIVLMMIDVGWITFTIISVFVFTFQMHCILNGENFNYIVTLKSTIKSI
jgi:hypothetical protein